MNILSALLYYVVTVFLVLILAAILIHNLPAWCTNPAGSGNWIIQPLCGIK